MSSTSIFICIIPSVEYYNVHNFSLPPTIPLGKRKRKELPWYAFKTWIQTSISYICIRPTDHLGTWIPTTHNGMNSSRFTFKYDGIHRFRYHFHISGNNCRHSLNGIEYLGTINTSSTGSRCLEWKHFDGSLLPFIDEFYGSNFCRMATSTTIQAIRFEQPWCYTRGGPEPCNVPFCGE